MNGEKHGDFYIPVSERWAQSVYWKYDYLDIIQGIIANNAEQRIKGWIPRHRQGDPITEKTCTAGFECRDVRVYFRD